MKTIALFLLFASLRCCWGQTDTNLIAAGAWSATVSDDDGHALRGRLVVYNDKGQSVANHARVYLELQHVFAGAWRNHLEIYYRIGHGDELLFEMRDELDRPVRQFPVLIRGPAPSPCWVTLPCDSTVRLRADEYLLGTLSKPEGLEILVQNGCWIVSPNATNDFYLSASFTPPKDFPSALQYHVWQGTLKLPKLKLAR